MVYSDGRIQHIKKGNFLKPVKIQGYATVKMVIEKKVRKHFYVHRIIAETFIPNPENKREVNHKDFNRLNNHMDNLEWVTPEENMDHAKKGDRFVFGENVKNSSLKNSEVLEIRQALKDGERVVDLAKKYNVSGCTISSIKMNTNYKKVV
jgi:hypothetical protein